MSKSYPIMTTSLTPILYEILPSMEAEEAALAEPSGTAYRLDGAAVRTGVLGESILLSPSGDHDVEFNPGNILLHLE